MNVLFCRNDAWISSPPDNTRDVVIIPVRTKEDAERVRRARVVFPRAAVVALGGHDVAVDAALAGAHGTVSAEDDRAGLEVARARRDAEDARVARETAARDEALWVMSHELRNPLNVIAMTVALLGELRDAPAERRSALLKKIDRGVIKMAALLDDVSDLSRLAAGTLQLAREPVGARALLDDIAAAAREATEERGVRVEIAAPDALTVPVDRARLTRAIGAAVGRVALVAPKNAGAVIALEARDAGDSVEIRVCPRVAGTDKRNALGRGAAFQLTLAARIVEAHGGRAWTTADLERATELELVLPKAPPAPAG